MIDDIGVLGPIVVAKTILATRPPAFGEHVDGSLRFVAADDRIIEAGGDGEALDDGDDETGADGVEDTEVGPIYTYHWEPPHVGGAKYVRCEHCGEESVPANPDRILHASDCPERQY